jgi:hypothetical protein
VGVALSRFRAGRTERGAFEDEFLVICPRCAKRARVHGEPPKLTCAHCGMSREGDGQGKLDLWLAADCCGHTLYANNIAHLDFLEGFVGATLRERAPDPALGWSNRALTSRLPAWLKSATNRDEILKTIKKLRATL